MSRRDTIIIAVLINTGLLAVLFMMAIHTDPDVIPGTVEVVQTTVEADPVAVSSQPPNTTEARHLAVRDELDQVLENFSRTSPTTSDAPVEPCNEECVEVTVKRGDYLEKIARANGTSVRAIMRANHLPDARIDVGQVLRIPIHEKSSSEPEKEEEIAEAEPQYYTIKSGDNPWKIAKHFHVRFDDLLKLNDLDEAKARSLKPGDVLRVR